MNRNLPMIPPTVHPVEEIYLATEVSIRALLMDDEYEIWLRRVERKAPDVQP